MDAAHNLSERLCRSQQRLETRLVARVGFPSVTVRLPEGEDVTVHSTEALNEVLGKGPAMAALREKAELISRRIRHAGTRLPRRGAIPPR
ncbi:hypothetical protein [Mesorhizobium sp. M0767]|uniref:hypothetical protein n=1 Tax=unclassified Mesorhizobium TaxID=325217 RepID=UPI0033366576